MEVFGLYLERPLWGLVMLPMGFLLFYFYKNYSNKSNWQKICDHHLLKHLVVRRVNNNINAPLLGLLLLWILASIALMDPVWSKQKVRIYNDVNSKIVLLDLSTSMNANDVQPSRVDRAKFKVLDILKTIKTGQTAFIVFAGDAFVVTPLTEDVNTITLHVNNLFPEIMPVQGSRTDLALKKARKLLKQGGAAAAEILLVTDGIDERSYSIAKKLYKDGHKLSVLAVGTPDGAPVPLKSGGFLKDKSGAIVIPAVDYNQLRELASVGGGRFAVMSADDSDINKLLFHSPESMENAEASDQYAEVKRELGPWLVLLMLPIFALGFRKGLLNVFLFCLILNYTAEVYAVEVERIWKNNEQLGKELFDKQEYKQSVNRFQDPNWKGAAYYRSGNLEKALEEYKKIDSAEGYYNSGNVLAKMNRLQEALSAYEKALSLDKNHQDAKYNKEIVESLLKNQEKQNQGDKKNQGENGSSKGNKQESQKDSADNEGKDQQQSENNPKSGKSDQRQGQTGEKSEQQDQQSAQKEQQRQEQKLKDIQNKLEKNQQQDKQQPQTDKLAQAQGKSSIMNEEGLEEKQSIEQWLRKVPDDPSGLLRRKFSREFQKRRQQVDEGNNW